MAKTVHKKLNISPAQELAILRRIGEALGMELQITYKPKGLRLKHA